MTYDAAPDPSARQGRKTVNESQDTPLSEGSWQPFLTVNACGRDWTLERAADMEALWESMTEFTEDERLPYWTELWPSSLVLADWLYQRRESLRGQPCLDLGCGIGLTALVAQWLGANVIGMDYEPEALRFARRNAEHNAVPQPLWTVMDWRKPAVKRRSLRFIWGGTSCMSSVSPRPCWIFWSMRLRRAARRGSPNPAGPFTIPSVPCSSTAAGRGAASGKRT